MSEQHKSKIRGNQFNDSILGLTEMYKDLHITQAPSPMQIVNIDQTKFAKISKEQDVEPNVD